MIPWIKKTISKIQSSNDMDELKKILFEIQKKLNFDFILYNIQSSSSFKETSFFSLGNFPSSWMEKYSEQDYGKIDPIVRHCSTSQTPICWHPFYNDTDDKIYNFFQDIKKYNLLGGVSIGLRGNSGEIGILSLAKSSTLKEDDSLYCNAVLFITSLQAHIHTAVIKLLNTHNKSDLSLTKREIECLTWTAEGKTSMEIANILGVSESTIIFHIKNSITKLEVSNRSQAISKAILTGLISTNNDEKQRKYLAFK